MTLQHNNIVGQISRTARPSSTKGWSMDSPNVWVLVLRGGGGGGGGH